MRERNLREGRKLITRAIFRNYTKVYNVQTYHLDLNLIVHVIAK